MVGYYVGMSRIMRSTLVLGPPNTVRSEAYQLCQNYPRFTPETSLTTQSSGWRPHSRPTYWKRFH